MYLVFPTRFLCTHTYRLLSPSCSVLQALRKNFKFECVVGMNGRVWVHSKNMLDTIAIVNAISNSEFMDELECVEMVSSIFSRL